MTYKRIFGIVIDSIGIGSAPDAAQYGNQGADTLGSIGKAYVQAGGWVLPNLQKLGLGNIRQGNPIEGVEPIDQPIGRYTTMVEQAKGKDSMDGHWEMMGLAVDEAFSTYPDGFPQTIIDQLSEFAQRPVLVNRPYSGTEVLKDYGEQAMAEGAIIVYTSGDSVLQIAAHEQVVPLEELYRICEFARSIVNDAPNRIGRIIARPFVGDHADNFKRTANRHDYTLFPESDSYLVDLQKAGECVIAIGKTNDIFSGQGIDESYHNESNMNGMDHVDHVMKQDFEGFVFTNLVDFDTLYGHRRDPIGMGKALMDFDQRLGTVIDQLRPDDLLMITADHGNDPGFKGTDHTREIVPLLVYSPSMKQTGELTQRQTFADFGATVMANFGLKPTQGKSFLTDVTN